MAFGLSGVSYASVEASCAPLVEGHFGALPAEQTGTATLQQGETGCHAVRLTAGGHFIQVVRPTIAAASELRDTSGAVVCTAPVGYLWQCEVPATGDYTIEVRNPRSTPLTYQVAAIAQDPASCARAGTAWNAPSTEVATTAVEVHCSLFTGRPGERILAFTQSGRVIVRDAAGAQICDLPAPCTLSGRAPYRAMAAAQPGSATAEVQVRSVTPARGCPVVGPGRFGSVSDRLDGNRCRTLIVPAAGTSLLHARSDTNNARNLTVLDAAGEPVCDPLAETCDFAAPGRYTVIADGQNGIIARGSYATTFIPLQGAGCRPTTAQGAHAAERGVFRAVGQVDCYQFSVPAGTRTQILLPPSTGIPGHPQTQVFDANGTLVCTDTVCDLAGQSPYRLLLTAPPDMPTGKYAIGVQREDQIRGCRPWKQDLTVTFDEDHVFACFTFTPTSSIDVFMQATTASGIMHARVYGRGGLLCAEDRYPDFTCDTPAGEPATLLMLADPWGSVYRVTRIDRQ
ncbi:hypothetical protein AB0J83_41305 [Actinoplanes sp. NPDC049596]|uniref:hypothetical protein n=1 Tax=unclassified Actinoplanes TaxID=2626549 RepID=UPI0034412420